MLFRGFNTMFTKETHGGSSNFLYFVENFATSIPGHPALLDIFRILALDFPQLLDALRKKLKFHINVLQGLKRPLKAC